MAVQCEPLSSCTILRHVCIDISLMNSASLKEERVFETTLRSIEFCLQNSEAEKERLLSDLCSVQYLFEFLFSSFSPVSATLVFEYVVQSVSWSAEGFLSSFAARLLQQLSQYFWFLSYLESSNLRECHQSVDLSFAALKAITNLSFNPTLDVALLDEFEEVDIGLGIAVKRTGQRQKKKARKNKNKPQVTDTRAFDNIGVDLPLSKDEAESLTAELVQEQLGILKHYFDVLRREQHAETIKRTFIPEVSEVVEDVDDNDTGDVSVTLHTEGGENIPAAYPFVQPMKAALYFESADGFGEWRILISTRADRTLRETRKKNPSLFKIIIKKIKELSNGHFSDDNQKRLTGSDNQVPIYEAKMTGDTRLVYHIDCIKDYESEVEWQVIRVFGIYTHAQLDERLWKAVSYQLSGRGKEYRQRCVFRNPPLNKGGNVYIPASFPPLVQASPISPSVPIPDLRSEDSEELHALLVLEKFVTFSQALLNSILADQEVAHVFQMSPQEQEIVRHTKSCYVLGRSGTGKTTTMLFKMLGIERTYDNLRGTLHDDFPRPRQIFVTQSRVLAEKVEEYYSKLSESHVAGLRSEEESSALAADRRVTEDRGLVDQDEEEYHRGELPKSFSELKDDQFPLFLTFNQLCRLLEADLKFSQDAEDTITEEAPTLSTDYMQQRRASFVSYETFCRDYWPHFAQNLTKNLDPALVFAEFMGVIKGSESALQTEKGYLEKDAYMNLSHRSQSTFSRQRETIYTIFQSYVRQKAERREYDAADRTHKIIRCLRELGVPGKKMDFIYVDEAQDNLLIDTLVLRSICRNPDGLFWAGDTAQTISAGSSFRFNDLKAFIYRLETVSSGGEQEQPRSFQLTVNYRSHGGIMGCANSVVQLITKFWPHAIDILAEERGLVDGVKPVFFSGWDQDTVRYEQFLFGASGSQIEFGAQQCILVRDDAARDKLRAQVGEIGLIMTLYESKGLEFNDVLLYNFFEDSTVDLSQWRVILNSIPPIKGLRCPSFDEVRHSGVCRELKFLYVAITRARKNLWIADASEKGEPMRIVWNDTQLIQNCTPGDDVPRLAMSSTPQEWAKTARNLFTNKRYPQAAHCYERAGMSREKNVALAYYSREQARRKPRGSRTLDSERTVAYVSTAEQFLQLANVSPKEALSYYRIAAELFVEVGENRRAAEAYLSAQEYSRSAKLYRKAALFDEAVAVVRSHEDKIPPSEADAILTVAKLFYFRESQLDKATKLFDTVDDALDFMEDYEFGIARADILQQSGRIEEAADLHLQEGRINKALSLYLSDSRNPASLKKAQGCILDGLWKLLSFDVKRSVDDDPVLRDLLDAATEIAKYQDLSAHTRDQLAMFEAIAYRQPNKLRELSFKFRHEHRDPLSTLLCLDRLFVASLKMQAATCLEVASMLQLYYVYVQLLRRLVVMDDPVHDGHIQRLFALTISEDDIVTVPVGTFLHGFVTCDRASLPSESPDAYAYIRAWDLTRILKYALKARLQARVQEQNKMCQEARVFEPCISFAAFGQCQKGTLCPYSHVPPDDLNKDYYHARLRIHLQQILIYQTLADIDSVMAQLGQRRFWIGALYQALYPPSPKMGVVTSLDPKLIPEMDAAIRVVKEWVANILFAADTHTSDPRFLSSMMHAMTLALLFDPVAAHEYIPRALKRSVKPPPGLFRGKRPHSTSYILEDLYLFLDGSTPIAISAGILFLKHVIENRINVDINALFNVVDKICASLVIVNRLEKSNLHDTTLPRSWIITTLNDKSIRLKELSLISQFLTPLPELLKMTYRGSDSLLFGDWQLSDAGYSIRNAFLVRLCKSVWLFGYNVRGIKTQDDVLRIISSIRKENRVPPPNHLIFLHASTWWDLVKCQRTYEARYGTQMDPLIWLREEIKSPGPAKTLKATETIVYKQTQDIVPLLQGKFLASYSQLRADAKEFVPKTIAFPEESDLAEGDDNEEEAPRGDVAEEIDYSADAETAALNVDASHVTHGPTVPSDEEIAATRLFQAVYRKRNAHKHAVESTRGKPLTRLFNGCLIAVNNMPSINKHVDAAKSRGALKLRTAVHQELEVAQKEFDRARAAARSVINLQKTLSPVSALHAKGSLQELKKCIVQLEELSTSLPSTVQDQWASDLKIAIKGIVTDPEPPKKPKKPELVVDDIFEIDY
ncbi:hypothetical protein ABKN59_003247 [Abortiporus biennis]